jgi:hypothetical protein
MISSLRPAWATKKEPVSKKHEKFLELISIKVKFQLPHSLFAFSICKVGGRHFMAEVIEAQRG